MSGDWSFVVGHEGEDDSWHGRCAGAAVVTPVGSLTIIHFDSPASETVRRRIAALDHGRYLRRDCPLCRIIMARNGGPE